jgi:Cu-Zn family superoxide dismutase
MKKLGIGIGVFGISAVLGLLACGGADQSAAPPATPASAAASEAPPAAAPVGAGAKGVDVTFEAKSGSTLAGKGKLTEIPDGVQVDVSIEGVSPGEHGIHVHEKGDCGSPDGSSAGGHFNPESHPHALPTGTPRHLGDLGNITVGADGKGTLSFVAPGANLKDGDPSSFIGKAIIIHEKTDDGGQPTGNAGGRIGCAEIK